MGTMPETKDVIEQLNGFLRGEIAAVETYRQAYGRAKTDVIRQELIDCMSSHERRVHLLRDRIVRLGGSPAAGSGIWGAFAKMVEGSASAMGEHAAIAALEEGEDHGLKDYRADLSKLDAASRYLVEKELLPAQVKTHRTLSSLKMAMH